MLLYFILGQIFTEPSIATSRHRGESIVRSSDIEPPSRCGSRPYWLRPKPKTPQQPQMPQHATPRRSHSIPTQKTPTPTGGVRCARPKKPLVPPQQNAWKPLAGPKLLLSPKLPLAEKNARLQRPTPPPSGRLLATPTRRFAAEPATMALSFPGESQIPMLKPHLRRTRSQTITQLPKPHSANRKFLHRNRP